MSELSELLLKHLPPGWSRRQVAREAQKLGHDLSEASATAYLGGRHGVPDDPTIAALAETLKISEVDVRRAAGVKQPGAPWDPPKIARYLRDDQRVALEQLITAMIDREELRNDADSSAATKEAGSGRPAITHPVALRLLDESDWNPRAALKLVDGEPDTAGAAEGANEIRRLIPMTKREQQAARRSAKHLPRGPRTQSAD